MELIGLIVFAILVFIGIGLFGHLLNFFEIVFGWLFDGFMNSIGCLIWIVLGVLVLISIMK